MLRRFLLRLAALLAPFALFLGFPFAVMWMAGEFTSLEKVAAAQQGPAEVIYLPAYSNGFRQLKIVMTSLRRRPVMAVGTSRVMQIRAAFFRDPSAFYNAGGAVYDMSQFDEFLDVIGSDPAAQPRVLIVGFDQNFFNGAWQPPEIDTFVRENRLVANGKAFQRTWKYVYRDYLRRKISLREIARHAREGRRFGLSAMMTGSGFRNDGSYFYASEIGRASRGQFPVAERIAPHLNEIEARDTRLMLGSTVSAAALEELEQFLDRCRRRGIHVVAFLPPYAHEVYARLHASPRHRYIDRIAPAIAPRFRARGYTLADYSDLAALGASDNEVIDGIHASEKAYLRVLLALAKEDLVLRQYVDIPRLEQTLMSSKNDLEVF